MSTKKRKSYRAADFRRWLNRRPAELFGTTECDCPLAKWLGEDVTYDVLDNLPAWANRFVGAWDEKVTTGAAPGDGAKALRTLTSVSA